VSWRRQLAIIALVYVIEGFPMGVYADVWPVFFRRHGATLAEIGWLSGLSIAWSLKVLWSPLVDRFGERRRWIAACVAVMAGCLMVFSGAPSDGVSALVAGDRGVSASLAAGRRDRRLPIARRARARGPANSVRSPPTAWAWCGRDAAAPALDRMVRGVLARAPGVAFAARCSPVRVTVPRWRGAKLPCPARAG
jgi:MFS family permease